MKKIITLLFVLTMIFAFAACDNGTKETSSTSSAPDFSQGEKNDSTDIEPDSIPQGIIIPAPVEPEAEPEVEPEVKPETPDLELPEDTNVETPHTHVYTTKVTKEATCVTEGVKTTTCLSCSYKTTESITKLGHSYKSVVTAPTCTVKGYTTNTCTRCSDSYKSKEKNATGHTTTTKTTKAATCTADGTKTTSCSKCSYKTTATITKLGHNYENIITRPTCSKQGYTSHECTRCSYNYKDTYTAAKGHSFKVTGTTTMTAKCDACGQYVTQNKNVRSYQAIGNSAYWKDGELHVQFLLFNTYDQACKVNNITNMYFFTKSGTRISVTLNLSSLNITVPANGIHIHNLTIAAKHVQNYGIDVSSVGMYVESVS